MFNKIYKNKKNNSADVVVETADDIAADTKSTVISTKKGYRNRNMYKASRKCQYLISTGKKCMAVALKTSPYCRAHIFIYKSVREKNQSIVNQPDKSSLQSTDHQKENLELNDEIALLKNYLHRIVKTSNKKIIEPSEIRLQLALIEQIRRLIESLNRIEVQSKVYFIVNKIISSVVKKISVIINKYITDAPTKEVIISELMSIAKIEENEGDLRGLLKLVDEEKTRPTFEVVDGKRQ